MKSRHLLFFVILFIFLEECCLKNHQKRRFQQNTTPRYYSALKGEMFAMPCDYSSSRRSMETVWFKMEHRSEENQSSSIHCMTTFITEIKHSGNYRSSTSRTVLHLQIWEEINTTCFEAKRENVYLIATNIGKIPCPAFFCDNNTHVIWYKKNKLVSELPRFSRVSQGVLELEVDMRDTGVYFCDRLITKGGIQWTLRRAVNVKAIMYGTATYLPRITEANKTVEVELGQPHNLMCEVTLNFELKPSSKVEWYMNYGGNTKSRTLLASTSERKSVAFQDEVTQTAVIKEVTPQHLNNTYTCIASNSIGNNSITVKFKRKIKATRPSLMYPITSVLLVAVFGVILHVKWLEIQMIYKSYFKYGKPREDEKEFDVFLSYVWSASSAEAEVTQRLNVSSRPGLSRDELLPITVDKTSKKPLEVLLRHTLEDQWGYRLCLLERDVIPGGAYTNDVVLAIKRSRMLICVLSTEYLANSSAVFVLESGVQALLQTSAFQLLLIRTSGDSMSHNQPDLPLPKLVQTALRVLPSLDWSLGKPARGTSNFWKSLRNSLPRHRECSFSL